MAELMGREDGLCHGLGGSMHLVDKEHGFMGATGVVGGNLPLALGTALASGSGHGPGHRRVLRRRRGPGGALQRVDQPRGAVEAAGDLRVREQRLRRVHLAGGALDDRAGQRRRRAVRVRPRDGQGQRRAGGVRGVRRNTSAARAGEGPYLLECLTFRRRGHYEGDPEKYRDPEAERMAGAIRSRASAPTRRAGLDDETARGAIEREAGA